MPEKVKTPRRKKEKLSSSNISKDSCFTIMPFSGWFDDYYETIYCPAIEAAGLEPKRADDLYRPSTIINDIWSYTQAAKIILADLTGKNPNVFYELGLAHALAKPAILIAESMNDVPFDLRSLRVLEYDKNQPNWGKLLQDKITKSINEVLKSPLDAVLPTFLNIKPSSKTKAVSEHEKEILEIKQELDMMKREIRMPRYTQHDIINSSEEAERVLKNYREMRMPIDLIRIKMLKRGVPEKWIERQLEEISKPLFDDKE